MKSKKNLIIIAIVIAISLIGITYAFFDYYMLGSNQKVTAGKVNLILNEGEDTINRGNIFPETVEKARSRKDNFITFTVSGVNTTEDQDIYYEIMLNDGDNEAGMTRFNPEDLVFDLIELNEDGTEGDYVVDALSYSDFNARRIWVDTVDRNTSETVNKTYKLRMWLSEDVLISDSNSNANYPSTGYENYYASVKVSVYGDFVEKSMPITYPVSLLTLLEKNLSISEANDSGTRYITGNINQTEKETDNNSLSDVKPNNLLNSTSQTSDNVTKIGTTVEVSNYVWYSGKLWRIFAINQDGSIKMVTQGNVTSITYNNIDGGTYGESQAKKWLDEQFLPTLENTDDLLVDFTVSSSTGKVHLLSSTDYYGTGGSNDRSTSNTFLNNGYGWRIIGEVVNGGGFVRFPPFNYETSKLSNYGIRPSVTLVSGVQVLSGTGIKNDPFILVSDRSFGSENESLNERLVGEYIKFNNVNYRIVGFEEFNEKLLTKVTMADYSVNNNTITTSVAFGDTASDVVFNTSTGIGKFLNDWYNADETSEVYSDTYIKDEYKKMIATSSEGVKWYVGPETGTSYDYTNAKTGTEVEATIGLGSYGEMFSSQFGDGSSTSQSIWLITRYLNSGNYNLLWNIYSSNSNTYNTVSSLGSSATSKYYGVRPSFYLKSNVIIGDTDGDGDYGTGMPHDPYEIVQVTE